MLMKPREGYLLIDHRASPGMPEAMIRACGLDIKGTGAGAAFESPVVACAHCNTAIILNPLRTRARGYCRKCDAYVCDNPVCNAECRPHRKLLDELQEEAFRHEAGYTGIIR